MERVIEELKEHWKNVLIGVLTVVLVGTLWVMSTRSKQDHSSQEDGQSLEDIIEPSDPSNETNKEESTSDTTVPAEPEIYIVDVKGEVNKAGVYDIPADARVKDVIQLAGGLTDEADQLSINLAQKVEDQMVIYVAHQDEQAPSSHPVFSQPSMNTTRDQSIININTATEAELTTLNGIGESKAQQIIHYRQENGLFNTKEELKDVPGIGDKSFELLKDMITVK